MEKASRAHIIKFVDDYYATWTNFERNTRNTLLLCRYYIAYGPELRTLPVTR